MGRGKLWACGSVAVPSYTIQTLSGLTKFHVRQFQTYTISALESILRLESLERTYTVDHMYTQFRVALNLPARNYSLSREVSVQLLRTIGSVKVKPHIK